MSGRLRTGPSVRRPRIEFLEVVRVMPLRGPLQRARLGSLSPSSEPESPSSCVRSNLDDICAGRRDHPPPRPRFVCNRHCLTALTNRLTKMACWDPPPDPSSDPESLSQGARSRPSPPASSRPRGEPSPPRPPSLDSDPWSDWADAPAAWPGAGRATRVSARGQSGALQGRGDATALARALVGDGRRCSVQGRGRRGGTGKAGGRERGRAHLGSARPPPPPPSQRSRLRLHAATHPLDRGLAGAWVRCRGHQRRQDRRDPGRTESVSFQRLTRARAARQRAGSATRDGPCVVSLVLSPARSDGDAESGERARAPRRWRGTSTSQWRRAPGLQVLGWALMPVCWWLDSSAGETTTLVHL